MNYYSFNIEPYHSDMCVYHWCPQTLTEICRNMCICCGFKPVAARENYPGLILFLVFSSRGTDFHIKNYSDMSFLWELALVGFHSISSYFPHEFIMRNFMRISRTGTVEISVTSFSWKLEQNINIMHMFTHGYSRVPLADYKRSVIKKEHLWFTCY